MRARCLLVSCLVVFAGALALAGRSPVVQVAASLEAAEFVSRAGATCRLRPGHEVRVTEDGREVPLRRPGPGIVGFGTRPVGAMPSVAPIGDPLDVGPG